MPRMPKRRPKEFGSEPLVGPAPTVRGPGAGGLRPSFQARTRTLEPRQVDLDLLRQGFLEPGDVQARRARRGR